LDHQQPQLINTSSYPAWKADWIHGDIYFQKKSCQIIKLVSFAGGACVYNFLNFLAGP